jgi:hypothetical protein
MEAYPPEVLGLPGEVGSSAHMELGHLRRGKEWEFVNE